MLELDVSPIVQAFDGELAENARAQPVSRSTGSRNLPALLEVTAVPSRASASSRIARITAFMSPRTPDPLFANTAATRPT